MTVRKIMTLIVFCLCVSIACIGMQKHTVDAQENKQAKAAGNYVKNEIIVEFKKSVSGSVAEKIVARQGGKDITEIDTFNKGVTGVVKLQKNQTVKEAMEKYAKDPNVEQVQPNYIYELEGKNITKAQQDVSAALDAADNMYQWYLERVSALKAWSLVNSVKHTKVRVAVVDSGIDLTHPDLQANLNIELCANMFTGLRGKSTGDDHGHGTHVAGIIAAESNNGIGVAGVGVGNDNSCVEIFGVKVADASGRIRTDILLSGLKYASDNGAKVINLSLGGQQPYDAQYAGAVESVVSSGTVVVCSAGNDGTRAEFYPSDFTSCISVISTNQKNEKSDFSNYGTAKDLSAPGENIISTYLMSKGGYVRMNGTSMATPIVSGVAALVCSVNPKLDPESVKEILCESATDLEMRGFDIWTGYGLVNAEQAVTMAIKTIGDGDSGADDSGNSDQFVAKYSFDRNNNLLLTITTPSQYIHWWGFAFDTNQYAMREYYGNSCYRNVNQYEINLGDLERDTLYYLRLFL